MSETITVNVTQEDIEAGRPGACSSCPIALAVKREHGFKFVSAGISVLSVANNEDVSDFTDYRMPLDAQEFIQSFDDRMPVEPFSFTAQVIA